MFYLVQFVYDGIYHVCPETGIRISKNLTKARYGNHWYEAVVLCKNGSRSILADVCYNLNNNNIVVNLSETKSIPTVDSYEIVENVFEIQDMDNTSSSTIFCKNVEVAEIKSSDISGTKSVLAHVCHSLNNNNIVVDLSEKNSISTVDSYEIVENVVFEIQDMDNTSSSTIFCRNVEVAEIKSSDISVGNPELQEVPTENTNEVLTENTNEVENNNIGHCRESLCMYCGMLCPNLEEHLLKNHGSTYSGGSESDDIHYSQGKNPRGVYPNKKHNCLYCNTLHYKLARHLERKHSQEEDVKAACLLTKGSQGRRLLFAEIQKKGDFLYNKNISEGSPINLRRRSNDTKNKNAPQKIPCPYCRGFYSKKNLTNHTKKYCIARSDQKVKMFQEKGLKNTITCSRSVLQNIHETASEALRSRIFPVLTDDEITRAIAYDPLAMQFGNFLTIKYSTSHHHDKMIRNKLRHLSKILLAMRKIDSNIKDVTSIFDSSNFDTFVKAVYNLGGLNNGQFAAPSVGPSSVTLILHVGDILETEAVKNKDYNLEKETQRFCKLVSTRSNYLINKMAVENRTQAQREKVLILPKLEDIEKLQHLLNKKISNYTVILRTDFELRTWINLNKTIIVKLMTFNFKRPGDVEKTQIVEYRNLQTLDQDQVNKLDKTQMDFGAEYGRFMTRGKLNSDAAVLVSKTEMEAIELLLKYRKNANVSENNPYLFGSPIGLSEQFFKAGRALKDFCISEGLQNSKLNATNLRKYLASITSSFEKEKRSEISDYMGHDFAIHENIYKKRSASQDILEIGPVLFFANGLTSNAFGTKESLVDLSNLPPQPTYQKSPSTSTEKSPTNFLKNSNLVPKYIPVQSSSDEDDIDLTYQPNLSVISEESTDSDDDGEPVKKKKYVNSQTNLLEKQTYRVNKKKTWTTPEKATVKNIFKNYFIDGNDDVPSLETCQNFILGDHILSGRSATQIRAWIINQKKRMMNGTSAWTTPMKKRCREEFRAFYEIGKYPSLNEMGRFLSDEMGFEAITITKLRSHLQHDRKYVKKQSMMRRELFPKV